MHELASCHLLKPNFRGQVTAFCIRITTRKKEPQHPLELAK